ncbi:MAG: tandem-95 repeat protein [Alphaproteobacteria bacterium]|nr:tandem-95 repeat protein [Alphaproteobacteria bacterium]MBV9373435.1 tandem-95 repeat protein [Alphaproteobacteria bacterium]MBV9900977.1 tandem-95 repeat protein [Alphaproteobacteria bacterium]
MTVTVTRTTTLFNDVDGDGKADPNDTLLTHILIQNTDPTTLQNLQVTDTQNGITIDPLSVKITPIAFDDNLGTIVGNTPYVVAASALLGNDIDPDGPEASLVINATFTNLNHVTVSNIGGGNYQIVPETGYQGAASFDYTITDAQGLSSVSTGHVTLTVTGMIWYVDSGYAGANGTADGSYLKPFTDLGKLNDDGTGAVGTFGPNDGVKGDDDVDGAGDTIFVYNRGTAYNGGITLEANQKLYGDGHAMTVNGFTIGDAGANGAINTQVNHSSYGVTLASGNTIEGINFAGSSNTGVGIRDGGSTVGTLTISNVAVTGNGQAVDIDNGGALNVQFNTLSSTASTTGGLGDGTGVQLSGDNTNAISGTLTANAGTITGAASHGFQIGDGTTGHAGTLAVTYAGNITTSNGAEVNIDGTTAGSGAISFTGGITHLASSVGTAGILMNHIDGGTIGFSGAINIASGASSNGISIAAQTAGSVTVSGGNVTVGTVNGSGISVGGMSGGSFTLSGGAALTATGTGSPVNLVNNTGGSVSFTGGNLAIIAKNGTAFVSSNSSVASTTALTVSGAGNTINTSAAGTGALVNILNTKIATGGVDFDTISGNATGTIAGPAISINNLDKAGGTGTFDGGNVTVYATSTSGDGLNITGSTSDFVFNSATIGDGTHAIAGDGIEIGGANGNVTFTTATINNTTGNGLFLNAATGGAAAINGGAIGNLNDPAADGVNITGGSANLNVAASIAKTTGGNPVDVSGYSGTANFTGTVSATSAANGITLATNTGGTINFTNTLTLTTSGTNSVAFNATGGGTVSASGTGSTISSGSGVAVNVVNTNIGANDLNFQKVDVNGAANGIVLNNTGSAGGITVTGTGTTAGSGGTIQNTTQRGISVISGVDVVIKNMNLTNAGTVDNVALNTGLSTGTNLSENAAIHLQNVTNVTLDRIAISGGAEEGINGNTVANFNLSNSTITGVGNAADEDGIHFYNMSGKSSITSTVISNSGDDNVNIQMQSGQLDLSITGNGTVAGGSVSGGVLGSGYLFGIRGTSVANITIDNVISQNNFSGGIVLDAYDTATMNARVNAVQSLNNNDQIQVSISGAANADADITGSTFTSTTPSLDFVNMTLLGGAFSTGTLDVRVANNQFHVANNVTADSVVVNQAGGGNMNVALTGNTFDYAGTQRVILIQGGTDGNGVLAATVQSNNIDIKLDGTNDGTGILAQSAVTGPNNTTALDLNIGGAGSLANTFTHSTGGSIAAGDIRVRQRNDGTINLDGYSGAGNDMTAVVNYLNGRNNEVSSSTATIDGTTPHNYTGNATANFIVVTVSATQVSEDGATNLVYTFTRLGNPAGALTTNFAITGTATAGTDYVVSGAATFSNATGLGTVSFVAGGTTTTITVDPTADGVFELDESVVVDAGRGSFARALIANDDAGISLGGTAPAGGDVVAGEQPRTLPEVDTTGETTTGGGGGGEGPPAPTGTSDPSTPPPPPAAVDDGTLTQGRLDLIVAAAIDRWSDAGATAEQIAAMRAVKVSVTDMMGVQIGGAGQGLIQVDNDAGGYGWFIDATPGDDKEFVGSGTKLAAAAGGGAAGHVDLLTVLMHELGHQIGLGDDYRASENDDIMYGYVNVGERRLPSAGEAASANGQAPTHEAFVLSPVAVVGDLPSNKSVDIQFTSTVNPVTNQVIAPIGNSSNASYTGGNTNSNTEILSVDTLTLGDRVFIDANANNIFDAGEGVNGVALTLFADTNNNGVLDIGTDVQLLTTTTSGAGAATGTYSFANLAPGNYIVRVDASNFTGGGVLVGTHSVFGGLDPDNDTDNDDNGLGGASGAVSSNAITLDYNSETVFDGGAVPKKDINNSLDFGFVVNQAPTANPDSVSATEDTPVQYSTELTGNDTDPDLDTLTITAVSNFVNGTASVASGIVTFTPNANFNGTASFDYTISDGNGHTTTTTATVTVGAVSDPVTANAPASLTLNEDAANTAVTGLSIADVDAALAPNGIYEVTLSSTHGTLTLTTLTGLTFTAGSGTANTTMTFNGKLADINTALATAKYSPDSNYNGPAQISFQATDSFNGTVATGTGSASNASKNIAVTVNSVNDAPSGTDDSSPTVEGTTYTFQSTDFTDGYSDPVENDAFKAVIITTLPSVGTLKLNGVAISAGSTVTLSDLTGGLFTYDAPLGSGGQHPTFTFQVQDTGGIANGGVDTDPTPNTYTMDIAVGNVAPVLDLDGNDSSAVGTGFSSSYSEGGAAAAIADTDLTITDSDPGDDIVSAIVTITNPVTGDVLNVGSLPAGITLDGSSTATVVKLVGIAGTSASDFETAIKSITFSSTSDDPTSHGANLSRSVTVVVSDGVANSNTATATIAVSDDNDAPSGTSATITAVEDTFRVLSASDFGGSDVDGSIASVTISGVTGGKLYYDADGTAGAGTPVEVTTPQTYTVQDFADGKISFKANQDLNGAGAGTITFAVVDDDGAADPTPNVLTVDVTAVNDSPALTVSSPAAVTEQVATYILAGATVADVDLDAKNGGNGDYAGAVFSVNRNPTSNPTDDFELVAGANFTIAGIDLKNSGGQIFGHISADSNGLIAITFTSLEAPATSALVDEVIQSIRYYYSGDNPPASVQLAVGFTDGSPGGGQGSGATGLDVELLTVNITAVNDAPVNALGGTIGTGEDASNAWLSGMSISDPDADPANDDVVVTFDVGHGTLAIRTDVAGGINAGDIVAQTADTIVVKATLNEINATLAASNGLTYSPDLNFNGDDTLTVTTNDQGHNGTDPGLTGTGTSEEDVDTRTISVSAVDDLPVAKDDAFATPENQAKSGSLFDDNGFGADSDPDSPLTVAQVNGQAANVDTMITLASGAHLTVHANGTYTYDPNHAFDTLAPAGSGAVNTSANDSFTYMLSNGTTTANVTVTVNGVQSPQDLLYGDGTDNTINGTSGNDTFVVNQAGAETLTGNDGNDYFFFGDTLTAADKVDGGIGDDVVGLLGNYNMTLGADNLVNVERLTLFTGSLLGGSHVTYNITTVDANVASGQTLTVLGSSLLSDETLVFNGSGETNGGFFVYGGAANDTLAGGQKDDWLVGGNGADSLYGLGGNDHLVGGGGADSLRGGFGSDVFVYTALSDSTSGAMDSIADFQYGLDKIDLSSIDADLGTPGDQGFHFIGSGAFTGAVGEVRAYESGGFWFVEADQNGDQTADMVIKLTTFDGHIMAASDFIL